MKKIERNIFEVYGPDGFRGNAFIAKYPDGKRELITARHVVFDHGQPTPVRLIRRDGTPFDPQQLWKTFNEWQRGIDTASVMLPPGGPGIPVAVKFDPHAPVRVIGSAYNFSRQFSLPHFITGIGGLAKEWIKRFRNRTREGAAVFYYQDENGTVQTFKGVSGAPVVTHDLRVLGVHTGQIDNDGYVVGEASFIDRVLKTFLKQKTTEKR